MFNKVLVQNIIGGRRVDLNKNLIDIELFDNLIKFYEQREEYERCAQLYKIKKQILDHDKNWNINPSK